MRTEFNNLAFRGLIGETVSLPIMHSEGFKCYEHTNYYPFMDESKEMVDKFVDRASTSYVGALTEINNSISVKENLPFTEKEFLEYKKGNAEAESSKLIDKTLLKYKELWRFLNKKPDLSTIKKPLSFVKKMMIGIKNLIK